MAVLKAALSGHVGPLRIELSPADNQRMSQLPSDPEAEHLLVDHRRSEALPGEEVFWSPANISSLSPFLRNRIFVLMNSNEDASSPLTGLTIKASRPGAGEVSTWVPIKWLSRPASTVHKLGGRTILGDLERGQRHIDLPLDLRLGNHTQNKK